MLVTVGGMMMVRGALMDPGFVRSLHAVLRAADAMREAGGSGMPVLLATLMLEASAVL